MIQYYAIPGLKYRQRYGRRKEVILDAVCQVMCVSRKAMFKRLRKRDMTTVRHLIMYFLRKKTVMTLNEIGSIFHVDHSTVIHAERTLKKKIEMQENIQQLVKQIENEINQQTL